MLRTRTRSIALLKLVGKPVEVAQPQCFGNKCHLTERRDVLKTAIERWRLSKEIECGHRFQARYSNHRRHRLRGVSSRDAQARAGA